MVAAEDSTIHNAYLNCLNAAAKLITLLETRRKYPNHATKLWEEVGRFKVWAESAGAHRRNRLSLDYRLREASKIRMMAMKLLGDLCSDLEEGIEIINTESTSEDEKDISGKNDDEFEATSEDLDECLTDISHVVTCLYEFSVTMRNPVPRDRLQKCRSIDCSHYEPFDLQHAQEKFKGAEKYLTDRLGRANTRRRQLLEYHKRHHSKIAGSGAADFPETEILRPAQRTTTRTDTFKLENTIAGTKVVLQMPPASTVATTVQTNTTVSIFVPGGPLPTEADDAVSDTDQSQTSFASTTQGGGHVLAVPPPPAPENSYDGNPFLCPYCYQVTKIKGRQSWMHVFMDLRPYVCTFESCPKADYLFSMRNEWFNHEMDVHRREWYCNRCDEIFAHRKRFQDHISEKHSDSYLEEQLQTIIDRCERPQSGTQPCPLCGKLLQIQNLRSHLGRHLQQLSLFIRLPQEEEEGSALDLSSDNADVDASETGNSDMHSVDLDFESNPPDESEEDVEGILTRPDSINPEPETPAESTDIRAMAAKAKQYKLRGEYEKSLKMYQDMLSALGDDIGVLNGGDFQSVAESYDNMAEMYLQNNNSEEVLNIFRNAVDRSLRDLGDHHPHTLAMCEKFALLLERFSQHREAFQMYATILWVRGAENPDAVDITSKIATMLEHMKQRAQAIEYHIKAYRTHESSSSAHGFPASRSAREYSSKERYTEAIHEYENAAKKQTAQFGSLHPYTLFAITILGRTHHLARDMYKAKDCYAIAAKGFSDYLTEDGDFQSLDSVQLLAMHEVGRTIAEYEQPYPVETRLELDTINQARYEVKRVMSLPATTTNYSYPTHIVDLDEIFGENQPNRLESYNFLLDTFSFVLAATDVLKLRVSVPHLNRQNNQGENLLIYAIRKSEYKLFELLLRFVPALDINEKCADGNTALITAALTGRTFAFTKLLSQPDIDVNLANNDGLTPLMAAWDHQHYFLVEELLDYPTIGVPSHLLITAYKAKVPRVYRKILSRGDVNPDMIFDDTRRNLLSFAASENDHNLVQELLARPDTEVNKPDVNGWTALAFAAWNGSIEAAILLLDRPEIDVNFQDEKWGQAPLSLAAENGKLELIHLLLKNGASINAVDTGGRTALSYAAEKGCLQVIEFLIKSGADHFQDYRGYTPFHYSLSSPESDVPEWLVYFITVEPHAPNNEGFTAALCAVQLRLTNVVRLIIAKTPETDWITEKQGTDTEARVSPFLAAVQVKSVEILELFLQTAEDINPNVWDKHGNTPLHLAVMEDSAEMVEVLLRFPKIDLEAINENGKMALDIAEEEELVEMENLLKHAMTSRGVDIAWS